MTLPIIGTFIAGRGERPSPVKPVSNEGFSFFAGSGPSMLEVLDPHTATAGAYPILMKRAFGPAVEVTSGQRGTAERRSWKSRRTGSTGCRPLYLRSRQVVRHEPHKLVTRWFQSPPSATNCTPKPGPGSNGKDRTERNVLYGTQGRHTLLKKDRLPVPFRASVKTGYEPPADNRQVPGPIVFHA